MKGTPPTMKNLMLMVAVCAAAAASGAERPVVDTDVVFPAPYTEDFEIDGRLDDAIWPKAQPIAQMRNIQTRKELPYRADVRVAYSKTALYVGATLWQDMKTCYVKWDQHDMPTWGDDNLELFLFIPEEDGNHLYQFVVNPLGTVADLRDGSINWTPEGLVARTERFDDRWTLEMKIPFAGIPMDRPAPGDFVGARFCRWIHDSANRYHGTEPILINAGNDQRARFAKLHFLDPTGEGAAELIAEGLAYKADAFRRRFAGRYARLRRRFAEIEGGTATFAASAHPLHVRAMEEVRKMAAVLSDFERRHAALLSGGKAVPEAEAKALLRGWESFERFVSDNAYAVWVGDPWSAGSPDDLPADGVAAMPERLAFEQAGNEREQICLNMHGLLCGARLDLRLWPETIERKDAPFLSSDAFEIYLEPFVDIAGELMTMPLVRVPGNIVTVSPGRTVRVWIVFNSRGVAPGRYSTVLRFKSMLGCEVKPRTATLDATVWRFALPETRDWPLKSFFWGSFQFNNDEVAQLEMMHDRHITHGWTQFHRYRYGMHGETGYWRSADRGRARVDPEHDFDAAVARHGNQAFLDRAKALGMRFVIGWGTPTSLAWFQTMTKRFRDMGFAYEDFVYKGLLTDEFVRKDIPVQAKRRAEVWSWNTNLWFQATLISTPPPTGPSLADIESAKLPEFYRQWTIIRGFFKDKGRGAAIVDALRRKGCSIWSYACSHFMHKQPILSYYRLYPWECRLQGLAGCALWTFYSPKGDGWDSGDGMDEGICWRGLDTKPVPTKQFEAFREGLEDVAYMDALEKVLAEAKKGGESHPAQEALLADREHILKEGRQADVDAWRLAVGRAIDALAGAGGNALRPLRK